MESSEIDQERKSISVQCSFPDVEVRPALRLSGRNTASPKPPSPQKPASPQKSSGRYHLSGLPGDSSTFYRSHISRNADISPVTRKPQHRSISKTPLWRFRRQSLYTWTVKRDVGTSGVPNAATKHRRTVTTRKAANRLALPPYLEAKSILPSSVF